MPERATRVHWLRGNKGERTPRQIVVLDTESRVIETEPKEVQALRCWVARVMVRNAEGGGLEDCSQVESTERAALLPFVEGVTKRKGSWRLFTHNLNFDLGLTRLPLELIGKGWAVGRHNLASDQPWAHLGRGSRSLWLCDSWSWLPQPVEKLGEILGIPKPKLPTDADSEESWLLRCRADVEITSAALLELLDEWDRRALGWWSITGPASGWNTLLHFPARSDRPQEKPNATHSDNPTARTGNQRTLIVPDPDARSFERTALYSGRRDVWQIGNLGRGPWAEIDLRAAHLTICATLPLPFRRWAAFGHLALDDWRLGAGAAGIVAECVVRTPAPRYPLRLAGAVYHPVGEFATVLAGPEILEARSRGELVSIGKGYGYHLGHQMRDWAQWSLGVLNSEPGEVSAMLQVAVKAWGRSVPGRWGMTHGREIKSGPSHIADWALEQITVGIPPRKATLFHLAGTWHESISDEEADDSFPAVLAYIQSYCRLALNRMLEAIPSRWLVSCNTEGAWIHDQALEYLADPSPKRDIHLSRPADYRPAALDRLSTQTAPLEVRVKQQAQMLRVLSPQHHQTEQARLYSGVPRAAEDLGGQRFTFMTWPKLRGQIERGDPRGYVRERRTVNLSGVPVSRWAFESGHCEPVEVAWSRQAGNMIQPPSAAMLDRYGPLRAVQHPALRKALGRERGGDLPSGLQLGAPANPTARLVL